MKHLKLFFALFAMLALGVGNAWGAEETVVYTETFEDSAYKTSTTYNNSTEKKHGPTNTQWGVLCGTPNTGAHNGSKAFAMRYYKSVSKTPTLTQYFDINNVDAISFWSKTESTNNKLNVEYSTDGGSSWSSLASNISITTSYKEYSYNFSTQQAKVRLRFTMGTTTEKKSMFIDDIEFISTSSSGSGTEEPVLSSIEISGDLENKTYEEGDELDLTGLTVLANYGSGDPKDVTNDVEWSYEPLTAGQTSVTVTATYEDKTATQTINGLTVNEHIVTPGEKCTGTLGYAFWGLTAEKLTATANEINYTKEFDDVTVNIKNGSKANAYFKADHTRVYSGGYTMTFSVPDGYIITDIAFTASNDNWEGTHTANVGTMSDNKNWTGANQNVTITFNGSCRIASICVTYKADVKYALTITEPAEGGSLVVKNGETIVTTGSEFYEDTELTVTATAETGYEDGKVVVKDADGNDVTATVYADGVLTMPAYAVTISATFEKKPCELLATPTVSAETTYSSAKLTWEAVANAAKYSVKVGTADAVETTATSYEVTGLNAETEYTYQVQAIAEADQDTYCDSEVAEGTFTTTAAPAATLTLSDIEGTTTKTGALNSTITLPTTAAECSKTFVGWDADENCDHAPTYAKGAEYTLASTTQTLYAVYADGESGEASLTKMTSSDALANGDKIVIVANGTKLGMYQETISTSYVNNWELGAEEPTISELDEKKIWDVVAVDGSWKLGDATNGYLYNSSSNNLAVSTTEASTWTIAWKTTGFTFKSNQNRYLACRTDLTTDKKNLYRMNGTSVSSTNGSVYEMDIYKYSVSAPSYSNYSTTCAAAPIATVDPTSVTATITGGNGKVEVTYENVNTTNVSVALYNDEACTEAFTAGWLTASLDGDKNITYTITATTLYTERKAYIQLTAPDAAAATDPAVVVIPVTQAAKEKVFASLAELLANITPTTDATKVTVTLTKEPIVDIYVSGNYRNGIFLNVPYQGTTKEIEIYSRDVPANWVAGGSVSGTLTNCDWKVYNGIWELCPADWSELTYQEPKAVSTVVVSGAPTKTTYVDGEAFDPAGLTVTVNYNDATTEVNPTGVTFTVTPTTLVKGQTSVSVTATFNSVTSAAYEVTSLTVNDIPNKTVAEFIAAGGTRCYLEGIVSNLTNTTYGNFDLTDASGTIYVYGCLNAAGESQKFAALGVKNGDKIKVIADQFKVYSGKNQATDVQYVSHVSAASITISDITMEVGETKTIAATITPAEAAVTYTIKENAANAISLEGNTITALAEGTATITATVAEGATYLGNSVDFTVTVGPKTESDEVVILAEHNGQWYALKAEDLNSDNKVLAALAVTYFNGTLYNVNESDKISITWTRTVVGDQVTFKNGTNYLYVANPSKTELSLNATAFSWTYDAVLDTYTSNNGARTFLYSSEANGFKNFAINNNVGTKNYSGYPVVTAPVYATGDITYTRNVTNKYGTICLPYASASTTGAYFYRVAGKEEGSKVYLESVDALEAGVPYIFEKTANTITVTCQGEAVAEAGSANGLVGTFVETTVPDGDYILYNNAFCTNEDAGTLNKIKENRAYLDMDAVTGGAPVQMPGRRYIGMSVQGENEATGLDNITNGENITIKTIENGQLIIIRNGEKFNAQGQRL